MSTTIQRGNRRRKGSAPDRGLPPGAVLGPGDAAAAPAGDNRGGLPAVWDAAAARQLANAPAGVTSALALPRLDPATPQVLRFLRPAHGLPELAEAMLAEGMLRESDWCGSVRDSLRAGVQRWANQVLGGEPLRRIFVALAWGNELAAGMDPGLWLRAAPGRKDDEPICLLTVIGPVEEGEYDESRDVFVRDKVLALEDHREGLGFQVLGLLQDVLGSVLHAGGPGYGYGHLEPVERMREKWVELAAEYDCPWSFDYALRQTGATAPSHGVTLEEFLEQIPMAACGCPEKLRTGLIHSAFRAGAPEPLRPILAAAQELSGIRKVPKDALRCDTPLFLNTRFSPATHRGGALKEVPFCVRWKAGDPISRIFADYHESIRARDSGTNILWMRAFQVSDADGTRRAVREWKRVLSPALKACRLAELLHSEEDPTCAI